MPRLVDLPYALMASVAIALGLAFGSFLNVVIYRLPRGQSLVKPASRCPHCEKPIRAWQNIPLFGWLLLAGKARCCGAPISPRYPLVEALGGLTAWAILQTRIVTMPVETPWWHAALLFGLYLGLALALIAAAFIDLSHMILPDPITLGGTALGLATALWRPDVTLLDAVIGAVIGFLIVWLPFGVLYKRLRGGAGMGLGDAKLTMLAGAWFGWPGAVFALAAGSMQGTVGAITLMLSQGKIEIPEAVKKEREELEAKIETAEGEERQMLIEELESDPAFAQAEGFGQARLAFGPFLVLAVIEFLLFGEAIMELLKQWLWIV